MLVVDQKNTLMREVGKDPVNSIAYTAYGHPSAEQSVRAHLGYNGEFSEPQTGWQLLGNGYRAYNSNLMKFHSPDSFSPFGEGGVNAYAYCEGEPVLNADPDGHSMIGNFIRIFRPTTAQALKKGVPADLLKNSKFGEASVRPIKTKDVQRLGKVVELRDVEKAGVWDEVKLKSKQFNSVNKSFGELNNDLISASSKLANARALHNWAGKHVGKLGITREASAEFKSNAAQYDKLLNEARRINKKAYENKLQQQMHQENQERAMNVRDPKVQKHYLGDGWS